ncbi:response regulator [Patescibacteria group bacterium]
MTTEKVVLVVEDNPASRDYIMLWVEEEFCDGPRIIFSSDTQNCSLDEYHQDLGVDIIILDFKLTGITGLEILKVLRKEQNPNRQVPVIFIPGNRNDLGTNTERDKLFEEMNVIGIFPKPIKIHTIFGCIRDWFSEKGI